MAVVLGHLFPEGVQLAGWCAVASAAIGAALPTIVERAWLKYAERVHSVSVVIATSGLALHGAIDGIALVGSPFPHDGHTSALPALVVAHRIPDGIFAWFVFSGRYGQRVAGCVLGVLGLATVAGFVLGRAYIATMADETLQGSVIGLVCGALLHLLLHRPHGHDHGTNGGCGHGHHH